MFLCRPRGFLQLSSPPPSVLRGTLLSPYYKYSAFQQSRVLELIRCGIQNYHLTGQVKNIFSLSVENFILSLANCCIKKEKKVKRKRQYHSKGGRSRVTALGVEAKGYQQASYKSLFSYKYFEKCWLMWPIMSAINFACMHTAAACTRPALQLEEQHLADESVGGKG